MSTAPGFRWRHLAEPTRDYLFIPFTDATSGIDTYGGGRYIDCATGDIRGGILMQDFNKAYNPCCAYASGYNCPIPPPENDLPVAHWPGYFSCEECA